MYLIPLIQIVNNMKNLIFILLVSSMSLCAQKNEKIIFQFEKQKDWLGESNDETIFKIDNVHSFRFIKNKHEKIDVKYDSIRDNFTSYDSFLQKNKGKKYPEYFNEYSFYIFIKEKENYGCLIEVEKIWTVEDKIVD